MKYRVREKRYNKRSAWYLWDYDIRMVGRNLWFGDGVRTFFLIAGVSSVIRFEGDLTSLSDGEMRNVCRFMWVNSKHVFLVEFGDWERLGVVDMPKNVVWCSRAAVYGANEAFLEGLEGYRTGVYWDGGNVELGVDVVFLLGRGKGLGRGRSGECGCRELRGNMVCDDVYARSLGVTMGTRYDIWKLF